MTTHRITQIRSLFCCPEHEGPQPGREPDRILTVDNNRLRGIPTDEIDASTVAWVIAEDHFEHAQFWPGVSTITFEIWDLT